MKKLVSRSLTALSIAIASISGAKAQTSPVGYWAFVSYYIPGGSQHANQGVCFQANNTWYGTTQHWNGDWFQNGSEFEWYGNAPIVLNGQPVNIAVVGMSQFASSVMTGNYAEWLIPGTPPLAWDKHYTYQLVYQGAVCPPPV